MTARLRKWIVSLSVVAVLLVVIVTLYQPRRHVQSKTVYSAESVPSPGDPQTDSEAQHMLAVETQHVLTVEAQHVLTAEAQLVLTAGPQTDSEAQHVLEVEAMYKRLVVLTAFSSNHFIEALDMVGSVQKYLPHTKIIVYDIGLTAEERGNVSQFCNVELRYFNFTKYPQHVKMNINNYAWKPLILQELVDQEYDLILYGDASLRLTAYNITTALQSLLDFPFLDIMLESHSIISTTHDKMIEYFQFPPSRRHMARWRTIQSGGWFLLLNDIAKKKLIAPWTDCALHEECISPEGARKKPCNFALNSHNDGTYVGCHRYDQSALDIILAKNFGLKVWGKVVRNDITSKFASVVRRAQGIYPVKHHPHCTQA